LPDFVEVQFEPPFKLDVINEVADMGMDSVGIHVESFDPAVLAHVAPAKARTGIERYFESWERAVSLFGVGQVSTFVILGMGEDPDLTVEGDHLRFIWWDSRNDPSYSLVRPIGNDASGNVGPSLDVYTATASKALVPSTAVKLTDVMSNPNFDQFSGRTVPFGGDYLWIDSQGTRTYAAWTDWRDTVAGNDQRTPGPTKGAEVLQCRTDLGGGVFSGDTCPRDGGLDQNIYGSLTP